MLFLASAPLAGVKSIGYNGLHLGPGKWKRELVFNICRACVIIVVLACLGPSLAAAAKPSSKQTTISVKNMHCSTCAKKIAARLYAVPGVLEVRANVKKNIAYVVPQKSKSPSPRAMWLAVEDAGFKPAKMTGPAGRFTSKPKK